MNDPGTIALTVFACLPIGVAVFWFRCRQQFYYGLAEIVVALAVVFFTFYPHSANVVLVTGETPPLLGYFLYQGLAVLLGIYIVVRGLDNMNQGRWPAWIPHSWRATWDRGFRRQ